MSAEKRFDNNYVAAFSRFELLYRFFLIPLSVIALLALFLGYHRIKAKFNRSYVFHRNGGAIEVYIPSYRIRLPIRKSNGQVPTTIKIAKPSQMKNSLNDL